MLRINCAPNWFHLQDYIEMYGQQNIKFDVVFSTGSILEHVFDNLSEQRHLILSPNLIPLNQP